MVSLAPSQGQRHGGFSFGHGSDRDSIRSEEVDLLNESEHLNVSVPPVNRVQFVPSYMYISWIIVGFEAILLVLLEIMMFVLAQGLGANILGGQDPPFSTLVFFHMLLWFIFMAFHFILAYQHNRLRLRGYLVFYRQTKNLRNFPPIVLSFGNALFLGLFAVMDHAWANSSFKHYYFVQIVYTLEFIIIFPALIYYISKVVSFHKERALPDAYTLVDSSIRLEPEGQIGYSEVGWPYGILEKQADMIRFLQQHNENLSRRLLRLSSQAQGQ